MADSNEGPHTERKAPDHHAVGPQAAVPVMERAAGLDSAGLLGVGSSLTERLAGAQGRGNGPVRQAALQRMQRTQGNRAVQRFLQSHSAPAAPVMIQRTAATADPPTADAEAEAEAAPEMEAAAPAGPDPEAQAELAQLGAGVGDYSGGGGGGGGAVPAPPKPAAPPDVANAEPAAALGSLSALPPVTLANALGSVGGAISHTVGKEQTDLAAHPPQLERPGGPPTPAAGPRGPLSRAERAEARVERAEGRANGSGAPAGPTTTTPKPPPAQLPPTQVGAAVRTPQVPPPSADGKASPAAAAQVRAAVDGLPTSDPALNVTVGPAPKLTLSGDTDPSRVQQQQASVTQTTAQMTQQGAQDAAQPMGEDHIQPDVPHEILKAEVGGAGSAPGGAAGDHAALAGAAGGLAGNDAVSIIAQQQRGEQIRAAIAQGQAAMAAKRQEHTAAIAKEQTTNKQTVDKLIADNATAQDKQRTEAQAGVQKLRADWTKEQRDLTSKAGTDATTVTRDANSKVQTEQTRADSEAATHVEAGNQEIANARTQAEREAGAKREEAKGKSDDGGVFGWIADKVSSFFEGLKNAIVGIFDAARKLVTAAIDKARQLATAVIDKARQAVVGLIEAAGKALLAITDTLLAAFPALRDRFHSLIEKAVKAATDFVNKLAQQLKDGVQAALNLLGKALNAALGLLQQGLLSVLDTVKTAVKGAIDFAKAAIEALGEFASLVGDIAGNPGAWLHNLAAGVMDGLKNHLWAALKGAVQGWFHSKVDGLLGIGQAIWTVLKGGGIDLAQVGKMAWEALKAAIPAALIQILVEKLVSMIVPAAGAILAIIEGLRAAWGAASRILQAIQRFIAFLKAVKSGNAGPAFGAAVAAGAVAVIDFVANWLLTKIKGAASKVGEKIKSIAQKILARLKKVGSKVVGAVKRGAGRVMHALGNTRVGQAVKRGYETVRNTVNKGKARVEQWQKDREAKKNAGKTPEEIAKEKQDKLQKAVNGIRPKVEALLRWGVPKAVLKGALATMRLGYGLTSLGLQSENARETQLVAKVNPEDYVTQVIEEDPNAVLRIVHEVGREVLKTQGVASMVTKAENQRVDGAGREDKPISFSQGIGNFAAIRYLREHIGKRKAGSVQYMTMDGFDTPVAEKQGRYLRLGNVKVQGGLGRYKEIAKMLEDLKRDTSTNDRDIVESLRVVARGGNLPALYRNSPQAEKYKATFAALHRLLIVEGARGDAALSFGPMLMDMVGQGKMDFNTAFDSISESKGGGGAYPPSQVGAVRGMRGVAQTEGIDQPLPEPDLTTTKPLDTERQMQRQLDFIAEWISMQMKTKHVKFQNAAGVRVYIEKELRKALKSSIMSNFAGRK